jgi:cytochrome c oxidase subunit 4
MSQEQANTHDNHDDHILSHKTLLAVLGTLLFFTIVTILASKLDFGNIAINTLLAVAIAAVKSTFVLLYFMHLKFEGPAIKWAFVITIIVLAIIIGFTFLDIGERYPQQ